MRKGVLWDGTVICQKRKHSVPKAHVGRKATYAAGLFLFLNLTNNKNRSMKDIQQSKFDARKG